MELRSSSSSEENLLKHTKGERLLLIPGIDEGSGTESPKLAEGQDAFLRRTKRAASEGELGRAKPPKNDEERNLRRAHSEENLGRPFVEYNVKATEETTRGLERLLDDRNRHLEDQKQFLTERIKATEKEIADLNKSLKRGTEDTRDMLAWDNKSGEKQREFGKKMIVTQEEDLAYVEKKSEQLEKKRAELRGLETQMRNLSSEHLSQIRRIREANEELIKAQTNLFDTQGSTNSKVMKDLDRYKSKIEKYIALEEIDLEISRKKLIQSRLVKEKSDLRRIHRQVHKKLREKLQNDPVQRELDVLREREEDIEKRIRNASSPFSTYLLTKEIEQLNDALRKNKDNISKKVREIKNKKKEMELTEEVSKHEAAMVKNAADLQDCNKELEEYIDRQKSLKEAIKEDGFELSAAVNNLHPTLGKVIGNMESELSREVLLDAEEKRKEKSNKVRIDAEEKRLGKGKESRYEENLQRQKQLNTEYSELEKEMEAIQQYKNERGIISKELIRRQALLGRYSDLKEAEKSKLTKGIRSLFVPDKKIRKIKSESERLNTLRIANEKEITELFRDDIVREEEEALRIEMQSKKNELGELARERQDIASFDERYQKSKEMVIENEKNMIEQEIPAKKVNEQNNENKQWQQVSDNTRRDMELRYKVKGMREKRQETIAESTMESLPALVSRIEQIKKKIEEEKDRKVLKRLQAEKSRREEELRKLGERFNKEWM